MTLLLPILLGVALFAIVAVLFAGVAVMGRGGEVNRKYGNLLMRWRVGLQFVALCLIVLILLTAGR